MAPKSFYVDACIYLNLWQKEGDETQGIPYWKLAEEFFEKLEETGAVIYYSGFLLKEIKFICLKTNSITKQDYSKHRLIS